jgi:hypothetical protein
LNAHPNPVGLDPARIALIIVDMQDAFASKVGMFTRAGFDIAGTCPRIEPNQAIFGAARCARRGRARQHRSFVLIKGNLPESHLAMLAGAPTC